MPDHQSIFQQAYSNSLDVARIYSHHGKSNIKTGEVGILARNDPPQIKCSKCDHLATRICTECIYEDAGWLCDDCAEDHKCGEEMLLPVVNSPRTGVCGYVG